MGRKEEPPSEEEESEQPDEATIAALEASPETGCTYRWNPETGELELVEGV